MSRPAPKIALTDFLLARIDEDEAAARLIPDEYTEHAGDRIGTLCAGCGHCMHSSEPCDHDCGNDGTSGCIGATSTLPPMHVRVLADCQAKRQLIERVGNPDWAGFGILALPYAGHPDYQQEWKP